MAKIKPCSVCGKIHKPFAHDPNGDTGGIWQWSVTNLSDNCFEKIVNAIEKASAIIKDGRIPVVSDGRPFNNQGMKFEEMMYLLRLGWKCTRTGWNRKDMYIYLVQPRVENGIEYTGHINMKTATGETCEGWLCSQTDLLANDWEGIA